MSEVLPLEASQSALVFVTFERTVLTLVLWGWKYETTEMLYVG